MKKEFECDLSTMIAVEMPRNSRNPGMQLRISEKNRLSMSGKLLQDVKKRNSMLQFRFLHREDYKKIAFENLPEAKDVFKFRADGITVHPDFVNELKVRGYRIPAVYLVEWIEDKNAWIGVLQDEVPELSDIRGTVKKAISKKGLSKRNESGIKV